MSIKSDRWIRRMAVEHGMIEPFEPDQVRHAADGHRIVSFGTSSYGYDIRCADEFKIFTNINSTIVDPKNFDEKSFVDFKGSICIIPPNSFALARTVEYFRIPRNVLTICLGKCVTADTRLVDAATGAYAPITEFGWARRTLALDRGRIGPARIAQLVAQGRQPVYELRTLAGLRIKATATHPFLRQGGWTALAALSPGDRIAVARSVPVFGDTDLPQRDSERLARIAVSQDGFVPQAIFRATRNSVRSFVQAFFSRAGDLGCDGDSVRIGCRSESRRLIEDVQHLLLRFGILASMREQRAPAGTRVHSLRIEEPDDVERFATELGFGSGSIEQQRLERAIEVSSGVRRRAVANAAPAYRRGSPREHACESIAWDTVEGITFAGLESVYDLEVPGSHNFVANGIVVHNSTYARCGIIVNVTPFEPEWEGFVTLEFSNTTPLPAKIYAGEGCAQVVFFESDEACEVSYKDRGGKYQGQRGVTLPKT